MGVGIERNYVALDAELELSEMMYAHRARCKSRDCLLDEKVYTGEASALSRVRSTIG